MSFSPKPDNGFAKISPKRKKNNGVTAAVAEENRKKYIATRARKEEAKRREAEERARNQQRETDRLIEQLRAAQQENAEKLKLKEEARQQRVAAEREKNRQLEQKRKNGFTKVSPKPNKNKLRKAEKEENPRSWEELLEEKRTGSSPTRTKAAVSQSPGNLKQNYGAESPQPEQVTVVAWPPPRPISPTVNKGKLNIENFNTPSGHVKQRVKSKAYQPNQTSTERNQVRGPQKIDRKSITNFEPNAAQNGGIVRKSITNFEPLSQNGIVRKSITNFEPLSPQTPKPVMRRKIKADNLLTPEGHVKRTVRTAEVKQRPAPTTRNPVNRIENRALKSPKPKVLSKWPPVSTRKAAPEEPKAKKQESRRKSANVQYIQQYFAENSNLPQSKATTGARDEANSNQQEQKSLRRLAAQKPVQTKRRSFEKNVDNKTSTSTAKQTEEGSFFPFGSDKPTEKKNKSIFRRFNFLGGKKKAKKDNASGKKQSLDEKAPQQPAELNFSPENPELPEKNGRDLSSQDYNEGVDILNVSPVESSEPSHRVNYRVRYQGKTNLPLKELYGDFECVGSDQQHDEGEKRKQTEDKERPTPTGPDVWMTPLATEDYERAWKVRRVWDSEDLDEFERDHTVDDVDLMGALQSLLGVPKSVQEDGQDWRIQRVDDIDGEIDASISSSNEGHFDHNRMEEEIDQIIGARNDAVTGKSDSGPKNAARASTSSDKTEPPSSATFSQHNQEDASIPKGIAKAPRRGKKPRRKKALNQKKTGGVGVKSSSPKQSADVGNLGIQNNFQREENEADKEAGTRAYHYNPDYRVKPKPKDPAGQRYDYKVTGTWSMPFVIMAETKRSKSATTSSAESKMGEKR